MMTTRVAMQIIIIAICAICVAEIHAFAFQVPDRELQVENRLATLQAGYAAIDQRLSRMESWIYGVAATSALTLLDLIVRRRKGESA